MGRTKTIKRFSILGLILIIILIQIPLIDADFYADIDIIVDDSGFVTIEGTTNHPDLLVENSEKFTYKKQSFWLINITTEEKFSDYIYSLILPSGSSINYINLSGFREIKTDSNNIVITGSGANEPLSIVIQYQIDKSTIDYTILGLLILFIIIISILLVYSIYQSKNKKVALINNQEKDLFKGLTNRQIEIVKLLIKNKKALTQVEIENKLGYPKASVSRNVHSLELKGIIQIEKKGMSNLIRLKNE